MVFDFIEIGTSDFDTLIETASDDTVGLSIEPLKIYLDNLPNKQLVTKVNAAIAKEDGFLEIYYVPEEKIIEHNLPWWVRGSNSVGAPHPFTIKEIGEDLYNNIVKIGRVPTMSWKTLVNSYNVERIKYLKVDTEGYDHHILNDYLDICEKNPELLADKIKFERHSEVSNLEEIDKVIARFKGYHVEFNESDVVLTKHKIPRIIHQTYKIKNLPEEIQKVVDKLKSTNPTFEYRFYDDEDCEKFIRDNYDKETLGLYLSINPNYGSARADFFRYLLMYKVGGVYLDIKSCTLVPLEDALLSTDEYLLTHWPGKDWARDLAYEHGEFQNWHIICKPEHPFLKKAIDVVKNNIKNYEGNTGKKAVLSLTGPIAYSRAILSILKQHKTLSANSPVREFKVSEEIGLSYMATDAYHHLIYGSTYSEDEPIILSNKHKNAYVLYATEKYLDIVSTCAKSIKEFSKFPVYVYVMNSDKKVNVEGVFTIKWECEEEKEDGMFHEEAGNFYINRKSKAIYKTLIQRPLIVKHALKNFAKTVAYIDSDSIATPYVDRIFSFYEASLNHPYFVEGIYDFYQVGERGWAENEEDLSFTLEAPACELFGVDQRVRQRYRQTGYFIAGQKCLDFLDEWYWMCIHPKVLENNEWYAAYNEETIANVLLWKHKYLSGLPYLYMNATEETIDYVYTQAEFKGSNVRNHEALWSRVPENLQTLLFFHGEKRIDVMERMIDKIKKYNFKENRRILFISPHLSTGGLPQYLLKKLEFLVKQHEVYLVEYNCSSGDYVVQRNKIRDLLGDRFYTLWENKDELISIVDEIKPDVIHLEEIPEFFMSDDLAVMIYAKSEREYFIVETTHSSQSNPYDLRFYPDKFIFASKWSQQRFSEALPHMPSEVWEYPIENYTTNKKAAQDKLGLDPEYKHILMVGLFTPGKNQGEIFKVAKKLEDYKIKFHFVGNQAPNFAEYWQPIMKDKPDNCVVWGEREDVDTFYQACDLFYFSSKLELNPLSIKEALSYSMPCIFRRLHTYTDVYDDLDLVTYIDEDLEKTKNTILQKLSYV
jgi:mannosyltransferase OCH1-like enzyme